MQVSQAMAQQSNDYGRLDTAFFEHTSRALWDRGFSKSLLPENQGGITVVIPYYRAQDTINLALLALASQNFRREALEVVVVDDGSPVPADQVIRSVAAKLWFPCKILRHDRNRGRASARNTGAAAASNEILFFLDADAVAPPGLLLSHGIKHSFSDNLLLISMSKRVPLKAELQERLLANNFRFSLSPRRDWRYFAKLQSDGEALDISNVLATDYFKQFGQGFRYYAKTLPEMVVTVCVSLLRQHFIGLGGFCEKFVTYGREDVFLGAMAISSGLFVVPDLNVLYQLDDQSELRNKPIKKAEHPVSLRLYEQLLAQDIALIRRQGQRRLNAAMNRVVKVYEFGDVRK